MRKTLIPLLCTLVAGVAVTGCDRSSRDEVSAEDVKREAQEAVDAAASYATDRKQDFINEINRSLESREEKVEELKEKAASAGKDAQAQLEKQLKRLDKSLDQAREELDQIRKNPDQTWEQMKSGMQKAMDDLEAAYRAAEKELRGG